MTAESGNSDKRFDVIQNSTQAHEDSATKPEPTIHQNFTLNGQVIITCPNNSLSNGSNTNNSNSQFNGGNTPQTFPNIETEYALMVLQQPLDYESTTSYLIKLKVEDFMTSRVGYITVLVGFLLFILFVFCFVYRLFSLYRTIQELHNT